LPDKWGIDLILRRLAEYRLLQEYRDGTGPSLYSSHPAIAQFFYSALVEDTLLLHEGVSRYLQRELQQRGHRVKTSAQGPVRVRGVGLSSSPVRGDLPRDRVVLELLEELIYHAVQRGALEEAFQLYRANLGGYEHLGATLGEHLRGLRIVAPFLTAGSARIREQAGQDQARYLTALGNS
jgi:hypothetical protein